MRFTHRVEMKASRFDISPFIIDEHLPRAFNYIYCFIMCFVKMRLYYNTLSCSQHQETDCIVLGNGDHLSFLTGFCNFGKFARLVLFLGRV